MYMGSPSPAPLLPHTLSSIRSEEGVSKKVCCLDTSRISISSPVPPHAHRLTLTLAYFNSDKAQPRLTNPHPPPLPSLSHAFKQNARHWYGQGAQGQRAPFP